MSETESYADFENSSGMIDLNGPMDTETAIGTNSRIYSKGNSGNFGTYVGVNLMDNESNYGINTQNGDGMLVSSILGSRSHEMVFWI